jgi:Putative prokaryotic signal transducing protein
MPSSLSPSHSRGLPTQGADGGDGSDGREEGGGGGGGGKLVKVAFAPSQVEAEMIQGLLSEHGIPSMLKRGPGFDVPEFMAVGPRQVFVAAQAASRAREVLEGTPGAI